MRVLVACEESQRVCIAFREKGHEAFSCDVLPCSGGHPEWHIQDDVLNHLDENWDLLIAHPPCTYLSNVATPHLMKGGVLNQERYAKGLEAKDFFMKLYNANIEKIAIENPTPSKRFNLPPYTQAIQPYEHGDPFKKRTCLWLKNLPLLVPTKIVKGEPTTTPGNWYNKAGKNRSVIRSKTFPGIAKAMAEQWS